MTWANTPLGDLITLQRGHDLPSQKRIDGNTPIMGSSGVTGFHNVSKTLGPGVVVGRSGNSMGEVSYCDVDFWPLNTCLYITDFKGNDPRYIYYLLKTIDFDQFNSGSAQKSLNRNAVYPFEVYSTSDKKEQIAIGQNLSTLEDKIESNSQINQTIEQIAQAIFKRWFVDFEPVKAKIAAREALLADNPSATVEQIAQAEQQAAIKAISGAGDIVPTEQLQTLAELLPNQLVDSELGEIPVGWEITPFSKLTKLTKGKNITKKTVVHGNVPVVAGGLKPSCYHNTANVKGPVITVSASGANAGYVNMYFTDIWASDCSFICSKATKYLYTNYVLLKLKQKLITSMQTGAAQPHIYPKDFDRLNVVIPEGNLFDVVEDIFSGLFNKIKNNELENSSLSEMRDILLPKLLSGEIDLTSNQKEVVNG